MFFTTREKINYYNDEIKKEIIIFLTKIGKILKSLKKK